MSARSSCGSAPARTRWLLTAAPGYSIATVLASEARVQTGTALQQIPRTLIMAGMCMFPALGGCRTTTRTSTDCDSVRTLVPQPAEHRVAALRRQCQDKLPVLRVAVLAEQVRIELMLLAVTWQVCRTAVP